MIHRVIVCDINTYQVHQTVLLMELVLALSIQITLLLTVLVLTREAEYMLNVRLFLMVLYCCRPQFDTYQEHQKVLPSTERVLAHQTDLPSTERMLAHQTDLPLMELVLIDDDWARMREYSQCYRNDFIHVTQK